MISPLPLASTAHTGPIIPGKLAFDPGPPYNLRQKGSIHRHEPSNLRPDRRSRYRGIAWAGLAVQFIVSYRQNASALLTLWIVFAYFTVTTNLLVASVFTGIAADRTAFRSGRLVGGMMLFILLVGVIYVLLLHGTSELSGGSAVANVLLHMVTPILVPLFWITFTPKGGLTWRDPLLWAIYPLGYLVYALARGSATGSYAYPFMNVLRLGWRQTALNSALIAVAFLLSGFAVLWIDSPTRPRSPASTG